MFRLEGAGSKSANADLFQFPDNRLPVPAIQQSASMSATYVRLGIRQNAAMNMDVAVSARLQSAQDAFKDAIHLLKNKRLDVDVKCNQVHFGVFPCFCKTALWSRIMGSPQCCHVDQVAGIHYESFQGSSGDEELCWNR